MASPKIVVYGNPDFPVERLNALYNSPIEISPVPATYSTERLEYLAPFNMILLHFASESEGTLEQIRAIRRQYRMVPIILAAANPSTSYLIQAYRYGLTDCLLTPYKEEQLSTLLSVYLKKQEPPTSQSTIGILPQLMRSHWNSACNDRDADFSASFLGTFRLCHKGERLDLPGGARQRSLLAYLFFYGQTQIHRDKIIQWFWPDHDPDCARNNLNVAICNLRKYLEQYLDQEVICFQNGYFFLNKDLVILRDMDTFLQAYQQGREAESRGLVLDSSTWYQSAAQVGVEYLEEFAQEDWTVRPREEFTEKLFHALDQLSSHQLARKCYEAALNTLRQMLYKDDCLESVHAKMISCYLALGKNEKAVRQYQECERVLLEKLKMRPSAETEALYQKARGYAMVA